MPSAHLAIPERHLQGMWHEDAERLANLLAHPLVGWAWRKDPLRYVQLLDLQAPSEVIAVYMAVAAGDPYWELLIIAEARLL